ncbi:MAG: calcium-binding protein [Humidesulfovibrio sp.]
MKYKINYFATGPTGHIDITIIQDDGKTNTYGVNDLGISSRRLAIDASSDRIVFFSDAAVVEESTKLDAAEKKQILDNRTYVMSSPEQELTQENYDILQARIKKYSESGRHEYALLTANRDDSDGFNCAEFVQLLLEGINPNIGDTFTPAQRAEMNKPVVYALKKFTSASAMTDYPSSDDAAMYDPGACAMESFQDGSSPLTLLAKFWESYRRGVANLDMTGQRQRDFEAARASAFNPYSPIILDLDGNEVRSTALATSTVHFDLDASGFAERTAWVGAGDGLLVRDLNADGIINDGRELFGNATVLPNGSVAHQGFQALSALDVNGDHVLNTIDAAFQELKVWRDLDGDGQTDAGELSTLAESGITGINTEYVYNGTLDASGNMDYGDGTFVRADGTTGALADIFFERNTVDSVLATPVEIPEAIAMLPEIGGSGNVATLRQSMALDATGHLKDLVQAFVAATDSVSRSALAEQIALAWAGAEAVSQTYCIGDGRSFDGRRIYALDKYFVQAPKSYAGDVAFQFLARSWSGLVEGVRAALVAQTGLSSLFSFVTQDALTGQWDLSAVTGMIRLSFETDVAAGTEMLGEFLRTASAFGVFANADLATMRAALAPQSSEAWMLFEGVGKAWETSAQFAGDMQNAPVAVQGSVAADSIALNLGSVAFGGLGNDTITGGGMSFSSTAAGGAGDDVINGVSTVVFTCGDGNDTVTMTKNGVLVLQGFAADVLAQPNAVRQDGQNIILSLGADSIVLKDWFTSADYGWGRIWAGNVRIEPADGGAPVVLTSAQLDTLSATLQGTDGDDIVHMRYDQAALVHLGAGNDAVFGSSMADVLHGDGGNDTIYAGEGNDLLFGGAGDDLLTGDGGNDTAEGGLGNDTIVNSETVIFRLGDGNDTVTMVKDGVLVLQGFAADVLDQPRAVRQSGQKDIVLTLGSDSIVLKDWFDSGYGWGRLRAGSVRIEPADGSAAVVFSVAQMDTFASTVFGTDDADVLVLSGGYEATAHGLGGNDSIIGSGYNDVLHGDAGEDALNGAAGLDTVEGGLGNDTILNCETVIFRKGDGHDIVTMTEVGSLVLAGFSPADFSAPNAMAQSGLDLVLTLGADESIVFKDWFKQTVETSASGPDIIHRPNAGSLTFEAPGGPSTLSTAAIDALWAFHNPAVLADVLFDAASGQVDCAATMDPSATLIIDVDAALSDVQVLQAGAAVMDQDALILKLKSSGATLVIGGFYTPFDWMAQWMGVPATEASAARTVLVRFPDGTSLTSAELLSRSRNIVMSDAGEVIQTRLDISINVLGGSGADVMSGSLLNDSFTGGAGDDVMSGMGGDDTAEGGLGDDSISGCRTVIFKAGDGHDRVSFATGSMDNKALADMIIQLSGLSASILSAQVSGALGDVLLTFASGETLLLERYLLAQTQVSLVFDGNAVWTDADLRSNLGLPAVTVLDPFTAPPASLDLAALAGPVALTVPMGLDVLSASGAFLRQTGRTSNDAILCVPGAPDIVLHNFFQAGLAPLFALHAADGALYFDSLLSAASNIQGLADMPQTIMARQDVSAMVTAGNAGDIISGSLRGDCLMGGAGADELYGGMGDDYIVGNANASMSPDMPYVAGGADTVCGGLGNDTIVGASTLIFRKGDGADTFTNNAWNPWMPMGDPTVPVNVQFRDALAAEVGAVRTGNDLYLTLAASGDSIRLSDFFSATGAALAVSFADGSAWTTADMLAVCTQADFPPSFSPTPNMETVLDGTSGADVLVAQASGDTVIRDAGGTDDELALIGWTADATRLEKSGKDAVLTNTDTGARVTLRDAFIAAVGPDLAAGPGFIERIAFFEGASKVAEWALSGSEALSEKLNRWVGTSGSDILNTGATGLAWVADKLVAVCSAGADVIEFTESLCLGAKKVTAIEKWQGSVAIQLQSAPIDVLFTLAGGVPGMEMNMQMAAKFSSIANGQIPAGLFPDTVPVRVRCADGSYMDNPELGQAVTTCHNWEIAQNKDISTTEGFTAARQDEALSQAMASLWKHDPQA